MRDGNTRSSEAGESDSTRTRDGWSATLVELAGGAEGNEYPIDRQRIVLGRGPEVDLAFADEELSAKHAAFEHTRGGFCVTDLGSTNGTRVNGEAISGAHLLADGDRIELGGHAFHLLLEKREKPPPTWVVDG